MNLRRDFQNRQDLLNYLRDQFPNAAGGPSSFVGGRTAAEAHLQSFDASRYGATRNFLNGSVSRLSPYIRHGVITLQEVLKAVRVRFSGRCLEKFIQELAWRDYWQRIYLEMGDGIWHDREPARTGVAYSSDLPLDLGKTGLACRDSFATDLEETGYLQNHVRMWFAAYLIHWRRVGWQTGAHWSTPPR